MNRFLERFFGRSDDSQPIEAERSRTQAALPEGRRLYSIGDIHGRLDLLEELHDMIRADAEDFAGSKCLVYLGDYIDRGSQSKQVLDVLIEQPMEGFDAIHLLGNHEKAMMDFLSQPESAAAWLTFGGQETLLSYGVGLGRMQIQSQPALLRDELEEKLPVSHREFIESCDLHHTEGSYCFAHAGIRPGVPVDEQVVQDLLWIREEFIRSRQDHGCIVVHGHSISEEVEMLPNRIGIDTGAFYSGMLTALVLEGSEQRLLQTGR